MEGDPQIFAFLTPETGPQKLVQDGEFYISVLGQRSGRQGFEEGAGAQGESFLHRGGRGNNPFGFALGMRKGFGKRFRFGFGNRVVGRGLQRGARRGGPLGQTDVACKGADGRANWGSPVGH